MCASVARGSTRACHPRRAAATASAPRPCPTSCFGEGPRGGLVKVGRERRDCCRSPMEEAQGSDPPHNYLLGVTEAGLAVLPSGAPRDKADAEEQHRIVGIILIIHVCSRCRVAGGGGGWPSQRRQHVSPRSGGEVSESLERVPERVVAAEQQVQTRANV